MQAYRKKIDANPAQFKKIISQYEKQDIFKIEGENYKRIFNKETPPEFLSWYQKKYLEFTSWHDYSEDVFYSDKLADLVFDGFKKIYPIYKFFESIE